MSSRNTKSVSRVDEILLKSAELFRSKGFQSTSIRDIGAALDITSAALYYHFKNKDEILALVFPDASPDTLAISAGFLDGNPVYRDSLSGQEFVVLTDGSGANRVYASTGKTIVEYDGDRLAVDQSGGEWTVREDALVGPEGQMMDRLPAHRAFWFGWYAANPDTRLVK